MVIRDRVKKLEENITILEDFKNRYSLENVKKDKIIQWALKYGLYLCITGIGEIACGIVNERNLGNAKNYKECIAILGDNDILDRMSAEKLINYVNIRDMLKRPYIDVDLEKLYSFTEKLDFFRDFVSKVKNFT
ncbi:DUF86 domain-containing protein [Dictyoglomus thermophilum]|uniref:DUF86 domain-containing protein n=2 Tax=Dictyoglomus thermophilum TaxID=14 RepID=B5YCM5_DICT6|nr:DUF86 domain-containing protein [Dictyoglomus thermophilum]ACI19219.1 protein of unknown function [Dictyoglomus thermophilum H-6-12]MCX7720143.1 DUF86 domain-containing protein [Dictyoglomus thermophilum]TYT23388.1 DUF86 domain-containing protein [Dictyoglomus thermophilum]